MLTVEKCVSELQRRGYTFSMEHTYVVSVKQPKKYDPMAAEMIRFLALNRDEVRQYVRGLQRERLIGGTYRLTSLPPEEGLALAEAIKRGETLMIGDAVYHESTGLFDITFVPLEGSDRHEPKTSDQLG